MKKTVFILALVSILLAGCKTISNDNVVIPAREDVSPSWRAFCTARNYEIATTDSEIIDEYLDTWVGSVDEEATLNL